MQRPDAGNFRIGLPAKGVRGGIESLDRATVRAAGWRLFNEDVPLPAAVLLNTVLRRNSQWMSEFLATYNASIAPHGKTSMSPQLFALQQEDGCWGITLATCHQVQVARRHGFKRILLANQVVGRSDIDYLVREMAADPEFDFYGYVDSPESVACLVEGTRRHDPRRPLKVFIEIGFMGGRCGVRSINEGIEIARKIRENQPSLALAGVAGFEGLYQGRLNEDRGQLVDSFLQTIIELAGDIDQLGLFDLEEVILSAGGSAYYDLVTRRFSGVKLSRPVKILTRSGCYLTHDSGLYKQLQGELDRRTPAHSGSSLASALEVWTYIVSRPEPDLAILSAGRRDFGTDAGNPVPLKWAEPPDQPATLTNCAVTAVYDQHASLRLPADHPCRVGDMIGLGVSHPCTTLDKWKLLYVVDDEYRIIDAIETFF